MKILKQIRVNKGYSQRQFAKRASLSFRGLQMLEDPGHDMRISSIQKVSKALGLPESGINLLLGNYLSEDMDSIVITSVRIIVDGDQSWPLHLFNFVDAFRLTKKEELIASAPVAGTSDRIECLLCSTVEALCQESGMSAPGWCRGISALEVPWFVSEMESLKALALAESSICFRKRNIFVLNNFMDRA
ncbi:helix-turn-helix domain-containing protein [Verrucomicrobiota bacterium]